ncbi:hypothetical protein GTQ40_03470 [Flavobacteriaceae bacterium R38]|nr:hypothetical protein [Flavobacteriaceae bacterium R38]
MCHQVYTIAKNFHGELSICKSCNIYHLSFNNLYFEFTIEEMHNFKKYVHDIEVEYWETKYEGTVMKRKIPILTTQQNLLLIFDKQEINALKDLIFEKTVKSFDALSVSDVDYIYFLN